MSKVKSLLRWVPPSEPHNGFLVQANQGSVADPAAPSNDVGNVNEVDLRTVIPGAAGEHYSFAVSARNEAGNIGDPGLLEDVAVDFTVPGAPTGLEIVFPA